MSLSRFKKMAAISLLVFALQMVAAPSSYAGCAAGAAQSAITTAVVAGGLLLLDCLFGCPVTIATAGTTTAAALAAAKAAFLAGLYGCVDASLWGKSSTPSPSPSR